MAKPNEWGLTDAGFRRPTYAELLDALEYKARELFGSKGQPDRPIPRSESSCGSSLGC